jgi:hypothetical protein
MISGNSPSFLRRFPGAIEPPGQRIALRWQIASAINRTPCASPVEELLNRPGVQTFRLGVNGENAESAGQAAARGKR